MKYVFEINDIRALITVINVLLVLIFGISIAWFGLAVSIIGIFKDIFIDQRINGTVMHTANAILNIYFITLA